MNGTPRGPQGRRLGRTLWVAGVIAALVVATNLIDFETGLHVRLLNASLGSSWSHRATAAALAMGAVVALIGARRTAQSRLAWSASAVALLLLFAIEVSPVHVEVDRISYGKLIYLPVLVIFAAGIRGVAGATPAAALVRAALLTLASAYGIHLFGKDVVEALGWGTRTWVYQLKVGLKEGVELAGWLLVVLALWRVAQREPRRARSGRRRRPHERRPREEHT